MKLTNQQINETKASYDIIAETSDLAAFKQQTAKALADKVNVPGFRAGKAPIEMVAKYADPNTFDNEYLNLAVNGLYLESQRTMNLRLVGEPKITVSKFVPYDSLEIKVEVPIIKDIKLPDYKHLGLKKSQPKLNLKEILDQNLKQLRLRSAQFTPIKMPARNGDLVIIDFNGHDFKTKERLAPACATNYRLLLGEHTLIPGFEDNLVGLKSGQSKTFNLIFPKEYQDKSFAARKVTFEVKVNEVNKVSLPKLDDSFAKSIGNFQSFAELKKALNRQIEAELNHQAKIDYENQILNTLAEKTEVKLADELIDSEVALLSSNAKQSTLQQGQTWNEFLASRGQSEKQYAEELKQAAVIRVKGGLAIGEIANKENVSISDSELNEHIEGLKKQYSDPGMLAELDKPNNRRELAMRLLTEKVLNLIGSY